jgi:hypothetical protein
MATKSRIYKSTDWQIWTYVPEPNSFILDFSKLNSVDTLGLTTGSVIPLDAKISEISITNGSEISNGIFSDIQPGSLNATLVIDDFDISISKKFLLNQDIWVTYKNAQSWDDPIFGKNTPAFMGKIRSSSISVDPKSQITTVDITATTVTEDNLNYQLRITKSFSYKQSLIRNACESVGINFAPKFFGGQMKTFADTKTEVKTLGEWLADCSITDMVIIYDIIEATAGIPGELRWEPFIETNFNYIDSPFGYPITPVTEINLIDLQMDWSGAGSPTGVTLTNYSNPDLVFQFGSSATDLTSGAFNYSGTVDVKDINEMVTLKNEMLSMFKTFAPISITTQIATNYQDIVFDDDYFYNVPGYYLAPKGLVKIGFPVSIDLPSYGINNQKMMVTGRTMNITPDNWTVTYQLWKGFTN